MPASTFIFYFITKRRAARELGCSTSWQQKMLRLLSLSLAQLPWLGWVWESAWGTERGHLGAGEDFVWTEGRSRDPQVSEAWSLQMGPTVCSSAAVPLTSVASCLLRLAPRWRWSASPIPDQNPGTAGSTMAPS